jgi:signal transduction histidine kinase
MWELLERLFGGGFMPHGHCYLWSPGMVWTQVTSNTLIGVAYLSISVTLAYLVWRVKLPFSWVYIAFGIFILACGFTHLLDVATMWHPIYWADAGVRIVTAAASVGTAILVFPLVPKVLALTKLSKLAKDRGDKLEALNASLQQRVDQAVAELRSKDHILITQGRQAAMGEMIGNIAHQWRQPLNALSLVLANVRDASRFGELDRAAVEEAVDDANRLVQTMSTTISDFRNFLAPGKRKIVFSARTVIEETQRLVGASYRHDGIEIALEGASDVRLLGFPNEYSQVVLNLLSNARQAIQASKVTAGRITLWLETREDLGCLVVRDNGGGIPEAILGRIFEPYFSTRQAGSGIGLTMSRQIVEQSMGGRLEARNLEGGAEFTVLVPRAGDT